ncbi:hypothetical protein ABT300_44075, partial [Streptomyces sp. NPDC001027]
MLDTGDVCTGEFAVPHGRSGADDEKTCSPPESAWESVGYVRCVRKRGEGSPYRGVLMKSTTSLRRTTRRLLTVVAAGVALAGVSGCTVPVDAVAGISVTDDGRLLGVMMVCGHRIDGATLYVDGADADEETAVGSWTADSPLRAGFAVVGTSGYQNVRKGESGSCGAVRAALE